jgi:hypothetical protein
MKAVVKPYEVWVWVVLLASLALLATYAIEAAWKVATAYLKHNLAVKKRIARLRDLTVEERHALQRSFESASRTIPGNTNDRVIASLIGDGILVQITQNGFRVSEDAWQYLRDNPSLVATPDNPRPPLTGHEWMG